MHKEKQSFSLEIFITFEGGREGDERKLKCAGARAGGGCDDPQMCMNVEKEFCM